MNYYMISYHHKWYIYFAHLTFQERFLSRLLRTNLRITVHPELGIPGVFSARSWGPDFDARRSHRASVVVGSIRLGHLGALRRRRRVRGSVLHRVISRRLLFFHLRLMVSLVVAVVVVRLLWPLSVTIFHRIFVCTLLLVDRLFNFVVVLCTCFIGFYQMITHNHITFFKLVTRLIAFLRLKLYGIALLTNPLVEV